MKFITAFFSAALCIAIAATAYAQSLADIANKEKQRREQIDAAPEVITNDKISEYSGGSVSTISPLSLPSGKTDSENIEGDAESEVQDKKIDPDEPVDFQGRPESYWRETMTGARKKVKDLEDEANVLTLRLNELQTQLNNAGDGFRQESVQRELQKTYYEQDMNKENLAKAKEELADLEKEARKSGALPGWLR
ncbi:MAG: hypothetical protein JXR49_13840 [Acidobacteria bacterium]|nr:hypothetical protein [Acidobacteriota bacterium]